MFATIKPYLGNIVSLAALVGGFAGYSISPDQATQATATLVMLGGAVDTLWSLAKAILASKKPA